MFFLPDMNKKGRLIFFDHTFISNTILDNLTSARVGISFSNLLNLKVTTWTVILQQNPKTENLPLVPDTNRVHIHQLLCYTVIYLIVAHQILGDRTSALTQMICRKMFVAQLNHVR